MRITLRQIEVFAAIARTENVSRAAQALAMSQSAASSALVELERQFDCPLFDLVEAAPKTIKEGASKEEANEIKAKLEAAGAKVEIK